MKTEEGKGRVRGKRNESISGLSLESCIRLGELMGDSLRSR